MTIRYSIWVLAILLVILEVDGVIISPSIVRRSNLQRGLARSLPLDTAVSTYIASHNSFNVDYIVSLINTNLVFERPRNQRHSFRDQLDLGARFVEIDAHYIADLQRLACCHVSASAGSRLREECRTNLGWSLCQVFKVFDYAEHTGCPDDAPDLEFFVRQVALWLAEEHNANEFIVLYIETNTGLVETDPTNQILRELLLKIFGENMLFTPNDMIENDSWPIVNDLLKMGKRVMVISQQSKEVTATKLPMAFDSRFSSSSSVKKVMSVDGESWACPGALPPFHRVLGDATIIDIVGTRYWDGPVNKGVIKDDAKQVRALQECGYVMAFDRLNVSLIEASMWLWADDEPVLSLIRTTKLCALMQAPQYQVYTSACSEKAATACRNADDKWAVGSSIDEWNTRAAGCPRGYSSDIPRTPAQSAKLRTAMKTDNTSQVWLPYTSNDGGRCWKANDDVYTTCGQ